MALGSKYVHTVRGTCGAWLEEKEGSPEEAAHEAALRALAAEIAEPAPRSAVDVAADAFRDAAVAFLRESGGPGAAFATPSTAHKFNAAWSALRAAVEADKLPRQNVPQPLRPAVPGESVACIPAGVAGHSAADALHDPGVYGAPESAEKGGAAGDGVAELRTLVVDLHERVALRSAPDRPPRARPEETGDTCTPGRTAGTDGVVVRGDGET